MKKLLFSNPFFSFDNHTFFQFLESRGYKTQKRGLIEVKGKGTMETYFVLGKGGLRTEGTYRDRSHGRSLAAIVYGVVQARRKQMHPSQ